MKVNIKSLHFFPLSILVLVASIIYFSYTEGLIQNGIGYEELNYIINVHDHNIYLKKMDGFIHGEADSYEMNNDLGIAIIYYFFYYKTGVDSLLDLRVFSFIFNATFYFLYVFVFFSICSKYRVSDYARLSVFLNLNLIYFMQLVNKDMLTIFALIYYLHLVINKSFILMAVVAFLSFFIRQQLGLCLLTFTFLYYSYNTKFWMFFVYVVSSLAAGYFNANFSIISAESLGTGLAAYISYFNQSFFVGYLIFNPVRFLQYIYALPESALVFINSPYFDYAALFRMLAMFYFFALIIFFIRSVRNFSWLMSSNVKPFILMVYSFFICWLINPTINARYLMLIFPIIILGYFIQKSALSTNNSEVA
ncbi:hypothetical protein KIJ96_05930 [Pseudoalteromonas piscicida]|uniref:hypothetical protein n=1 Tax=Pseudoalteromonas piscicida TaxID=43662 RepID=UPI001D0B8558|nr:hypothetical protein [Pseudoalteromonas piscicida]UDM62778.1 hypothetical protein KIJ96_05930 [Pseudoalteromonas piscicida]